MKKITLLLLLIAFLCTACSQTAVILEEPPVEPAADVTGQAPIAAILEEPPVESAADETEQAPIAAILEEPPAGSAADAEDQASAAPEAEDHILLTLEAPLADGRTLVLEAFGRQTGKYSYGVREVRVYDGVELLQTVSAREANELEWDYVFGGTDGDRYDYTICWSPEQTMEVLDLNFDGNTDFGLFAWVCNNTIPYYYWQWDGERYQFAYTLQGVEVHLEAGEISSEYRAYRERSHYQWNFYRPDEEGSLCLVRQERECFGFPNQDSDRWALETWVPQEGTVIRPQSVADADDMLVLVRREIPVYEVHRNFTVSHFTEIWELKDGHLQMTSRDEYVYN